MERQYLRVQLSHENQQWLNEFVAINGRKPRILHVGNIANNAYNNAKILIELGLDCDVICYDYYHIMGCPEWEDSDYTGRIADDFRPDWTKVDLGGYRRPQWFAQGSLRLCMRYLEARRKGEISQRILWRLLQVTNSTKTLGLSDILLLLVVGEFKSHLKFRILQFYAELRRIRLASLLSNCLCHLKNCTSSLVSSLQSLSFPFSSLPCNIIKFRQNKSCFLYSSRNAAHKITQRSVEISSLIRFILAESTRSLALKLKRLVYAGKYSQLSRLAADKSRLQHSQLISLPLLKNPFAYLFLGLPARIASNTRHHFAHSHHQNELEQELAKTIINIYSLEFQNRDDPLLLKDLQPYLSLRNQWQCLFSFYDYVIGYSTDPIWALIAGIPYFAFEHGTIREIPYYKTSQGRLTSLAYRLAQHVFVTNYDCVESAEILAPSRFTVINHPYDEDHGLSVNDWNQQRINILSELDSDFLFFHPTRHDWVPGSGYADKSNDSFLRAFINLRQSGARVGLVCCSWGANVLDSQLLLQHHNCLPYVKWCSPLPITAFERMCRASDIVVDQFKLGAFGGVVFKAMAVGTPILTYLDETRLLKQYPECPPVLNCRTQQDIVSCLHPLIANPDLLQIMGKASREWIKKYHGKINTVNAQLNQIRKLPINIKPTLKY